MAKTERDEQLFQRLRARGLRKRAAKVVSQHANGRGKPAEAVNRVLSDLNKVVHDVEDRLSGGPDKRRAAAKKAVKTRREKAQARSNAARKAARTRARSRA
jgi:hypothetical protein